MVVHRKSSATGNAPAAGWARVDGATVYVLSNLEPGTEYKTYITPVYQKNEGSPAMLLFTTTKGKEFTKLFTLRRQTYLGINAHPIIFKPVISTLYDFLFIGNCSINNIYQK